MAKESFDGFIPPQISRRVHELVESDVRRVLNTYLRAWTTQDPELIVTILTPTATYP